MITKIGATIVLVAVVIEEFFVPGESGTEADYLFYVILLLIFVLGKLIEIAEMMNGEGGD